MISDLDEQKSITFSVIDLQSGCEPDLEKIALTEDWAKGLIYCDMEGFALQWDGTLVLMDECGKFAYCPPDRFQITFHQSTPMFPAEQQAIDHLCRLARRLCETTKNDLTEEELIGPRIERLMLETALDELAVSGLTTVTTPDEAARELRSFQWALEKAGEV